MSNEEQAILPQDSQSPNEDENNNKNNEIIYNTETESMPIAGESLLSRESYLDDDFKDDSKDNKTIWERCCGPIRAGSLRGVVLSLASIVFGMYLLLVVISSSICGKKEKDTKVWAIDKG